MRYVILLLFFLAGCTTPPPSQPETTEQPPPAEGDQCTVPDGALLDASFVLATSPLAGSRVSTGFTVSGCSRTFESTVVWRLLARDGEVLGSGTTMGGGVDGPGPFSFTIQFVVSARQVGHLEVFEEDVSDGEGFPPGRTVLPLVLLP